MHLTEYQTLSTEGMNIDTVAHGAEVIEADFGSGYRESARVGDVGGTQMFALSAGVLPDHSDYGHLIDGVPRFEYYYEFWKTHVLTHGGRPFIIEHRGLKYMVDFDPSENFTYEMFTADLMGAGVNLRQRRVRGVYYLDDGSLFDPADITGIQAWYAAEVSSALTAPDLTNNVLDLDMDNTGPPLPTLGTNGDYDVWTFDGVDDGIFSHGTNFPLSHGFLVACFEDAAFNSLNEGLISTNTNYAIFLGDGAGDEWFDVGYGAGFEYKKNGTAFANATADAPMGGTLAILEFEFTTPITADGFQIGQDRGNATRLWKGDVAEVILVNDTGMTAAEATAIRTYLARRYRITVA